MKRKLMLIYILMMGLSARSQNSEYVSEFVQNIIPPSPTAFEFSTYGNIPVNSSTGGFGYGVPLYNVQCGDISLPISVNYYSNGVKIDELSGVMGTDWRLTAGGSVSRTVKDTPDEKGVRWYPATLDTGNEMNAQLIKNSAKTLAYDTEQDWFSFSANGISGSFYFDENLTPHITCDQRVKITYELLNDPIRITQFTIIDELGNKYIFGGSDDYIEKNFSSDGSSYSWDYTSSWFLKEITSPKNNTINFFYEANNFDYKTAVSYTMSFQGICPTPATSIAQSANVSVNYNVMQSKVISSISFNGNGVYFYYNSNRLDGGGKSLSSVQVKKGSELINRINFTYDMLTNRSVPVSSAISGDTTLNYRLFLKKIAFVGNGTTTEQQDYDFEYYEPALLPRRLSFSKDKYGYNNGTTNSTAFSSTLLSSPIGNYLTSTIANANQEVNINFSYYGMLKKITYPTGGNTVVTYEGSTDVNELPQQLSGSINVIKYCDSDLNDVVGTFSFVSDGSPLNFNAFANLQGANCTVGSSTNYYAFQIYKDNQILLNLSNTYGASLTSNPSIPCASSFPSTYANQPICTVAGSTYLIKFILKKSGTYGSVNITYNQTSIQDVVYAAGVRVKNIIDYTDNEGANKRTFYYNNQSEYSSSLLQSPYKSSLQNYYAPLLYQPVLYNYVGCNSTQAPNLEVVYASPKFSIHSSSLTSSYLTRQATSYAAITEIFEKDGAKNGAIERIFLPLPASPGQVVMGYSLYSCPASNYGDFFKDKIKEEITYDAAGTMLTKKAFNYTLHEVNYMTSNIVRRNYSVPGEDDYQGGLGNILQFPAWINYSAWLYKNYYGVIKLDSTTETNYFNATPLVTVETQFNYSGAPYYHLVSQTSINSEGETLKTEYKYAQDLVNIEQSPYMQQMVTANRIGEPISVHTYNGTKKTGENHTKYDKSASTSNLLLPVAIYTRKGPGNIDVNSTVDRKLQFTKYDDKGNTLEYIRENGLPTSIIWGYDKQYPLAKIDGATYAQISTYASTLQTASNNNTLTNSSFTSLLGLSNVYATCYITKPLIGVLSEINSRGYITTYEYDAFGRLKLVRDKDNNILTENLYHFKP